MRVTIRTTASGFDDWSIDLDVDEDTTVYKLRKILAGPPYHHHDLASIKARALPGGPSARQQDLPQPPPLHRQHLHQVQDRDHPGRRTIHLRLAPRLQLLERDKVAMPFADNLVLPMENKALVSGEMLLVNYRPAKTDLRFPKGFAWGTATAAYQIEGAASEGGRWPSIWDVFSATPGATKDGLTGAVACDHYHRFREDVRIMKELGLRAYRFSISWSRLLPRGRGEPNPAAVRFYGALIDELVAKGVRPLVTLYHWDLPQALEDEYGGWLGRRVVEDFSAYAAACFAAFGDRVKSWVTLNEPWCCAVLGYACGEHAPGRYEKPAEEPYIAAHHMILAHAQAVRRYRADFQPLQHGQVGIALNVDWKEPLTPSAADVGAQRRALDWQLGWFADPIYKGHYPPSMRSRCGDRLPVFSHQEQLLVRGSSDFFGLNHYSTDYVSAKDMDEEQLRKPPNYFRDQEVCNTSDERWPKTDMGWDVVPWGLRRTALWIQRQYSPRGGIIVTENGCAVHEPSSRDAMNDVARVGYLRDYIAQLYYAIQDGADVRGYYVWSFMDNFEWAFGFTKQFGIVHVNFGTQVRTPKASARVMSQLAQTNTLSLPVVPRHERERA